MRGLGLVPESILNHCWTLLAVRGSCSAGMLHPPYMSAQMAKVLAEGPPVYTSQLLQRRQVRATHMCLS